MNRRPLTLPFLAVAALGLACGDEDPVRSLDTFEPSVEGSKQLSDLTTEEAQSLCDEATQTLQAFGEANKSGFCAISGALAGAFGAIGGGDPVMLCEDARQECSSSTLEVEPEPCTVGEVDPECTATVAEVQACWNDSLTVIGSLFGQLAALTCAQLTSDTAPPDFSEPDAPASCEALEMKCPGLEIGAPELSGDD